MNFCIQVHAYISPPDAGCSNNNNFPKLWCFVIHSTYFFGFIRQDLVHRIFNNSLVFKFLLNLFLGKRLLLWSYVGWDTSYLVPNPPRTLHSSEECPRPSMRQVFDPLFKLSTYRPQRFQRSHPSWGEYFTRLLLLYFSY